MFKNSKTKITAKNGNNNDDDYLSKYKNTCLDDIPEEFRDKIYHKRLFNLHYEAEVEEEEDMKAYIKYGPDFKNIILKNNLNDRLNARCEEIKNFIKEYGFTQEQVIDMINDYKNNK